MSSRNTGLVPPDPAGSTDHTGLLQFSLPACRLQSCLWCCMWSTDALLCLSMGATMGAL